MSVGSQHDAVVYVWDWKNNIKVLKILSICEHYHVYITFVYRVTGYEIIHNHFRSLRIRYQRKFEQYHLPKTEIILLLQETDTSNSGTSSIPEDNIR